MNYDPVWWSNERFTTRTQIRCRWKASLFNLRLSVCREYHAAIATPYLRMQRENPAVSLASPLAPSILAHCHYCHRYFVRSSIHWHKEVSAINAILPYTVILFCHYCHCATLFQSAIVSHNSSLSLCHIHSIVPLLSLCHML